jgi:hypothetical protein
MDRLKIISDPVKMVGRVDGFYKEIPEKGGFC